MIKGSMQRTITSVVKTPTGCIVQWKGETEIDLYIPSHGTLPRVGDAIVFKTTPSVGRMLPHYTIKRRGIKGGYCGKFI